MSVPVGTWSIFLFGPSGAQQGTLSLFTSGSASLTIGGATQTLSVLWDDTAQQITFTTATAPVSAPFEVFQGWAIPFAGTVPATLFAGTFWPYSPSGPASAVSQYDWYATAALKTKEKEKEKEKEKDKEKEHKDKEKDKEKEHEKHPPDKLPELQFGSGGSDQATLQMLEQRLARLEQQMAAGQSFIKPEERPAVGEEAVKPHGKDKGKA